MEIVMITGTSKEIAEYMNAMGNQQIKEKPDDTMKCVTSPAIIQNQYKAMAPHTTAISPGYDTEV